MDDFVLIIVVTVVVIDAIIGIDVTDTFTDFIIAINFNFDMDVIYVIDV